MGWVPPPMSASTAAIARAALKPWCPAVQRHVFVFVGTGESSHRDELTPDGEACNRQGEVGALERQRGVAVGGGSAQHRLDRGVLVRRDDGGALLDDPGLPP